MMKIYSTLAISIFLSGCTVTEKNNISSERFKNLYNEMPAPKAEITYTKNEGPRLTISAVNMPLQKFLRWASDKTGASIICDQNIDQSPVTIDVKNTPLADILSAVARRMSVDLTQQGELYFIGSLKPEDKGVLVRKVRRLGSDECSQAINVLLSDIGRVAAYSDGLIVVGDRVRVLQSIHTMIDQIESAESNTWIIQLYLVSMQESFSKSLGVESDLVLDMAATFATSAAGAAATQQKSAFALSAILRNTKQTGNANIIAQPLMLLNDGGQSTFQDGETIPIPKRTTSDAGTITTTGYDYIESGIIIDTKIREVSAKTAKCDLSIDLTTVSGYVETAPILTGQKFTTSAVLESGGVYLLGSMSRKGTSTDKSGPGIATLFKKSKSESTIQIWLRCFRISGPIEEK